MTDLRHPVTGHEITAEKDSLEFWKAAGYREPDSKPAAKKTPAKKSTAKKTTSK